MKRVYVILFLLVTLGVVFTLYFLNKDNQINWITYHNERFNYSISYPEDWLSKEESINGDGKALYFLNEENNIIVYASDIDPEYPSDFSDLGSVVESKDLLSLNSLKGKMTKYVDMKENTYLVIRFQRESSSPYGTQYIIYAQGEKDFIDDSYDVLMKVLETFIIY